MEETIIKDSIIKCEQFNIVNVAHTYNMNI